MKISQTSKLYDLLSDGEPHSTIEICEKIYGNEHLGLARVGARVWDIKRQKGATIESWGDKEKKTIWWYKMTSLAEKPAISQNLPKKQYPNGRLFNINL